MRQFLESVILFNLVTCRVSPVTKNFPNKLQISDYDRYRKFAVFSVIMIAIAAVQAYMFT